MATKQEINVGGQPILNGEKKVFPKSENKATPRRLKAEIPR